MVRRIPPSQQLICFDAAARHKSLTRAAVELSLTQSAVSRQILALEDALGLALFTRTRRGMELTSAGAAYATRVAQRLAALEQDVLDMRGSDGRSTHMHLACVPTFASKWLIPRLGLLYAQSPEVVLHIETRTRPFLFSDTLFDAAICAGTVEQMARWAGTSCHLLLREEVVVVCHPRWLMDGKQLTAHQLANLTLLQQSTRLDAWRQWFEQEGVDAPRASAGPRYEQFSMTVAAAVHGQGVALVPRLLVESELTRGELVIANASRLTGERAYYLVIPTATATPTNAMNLFFIWLRQQTADLADSPQTNSK